MDECENKKRRLEFPDPEEIQPSKRNLKHRLLLTEIAEDGLEIKSFDRSQHTKLQKRFKYKLTLPFTAVPAPANASTVERVYLDAWVMDNNLCILMLPFHLDHVISVETNVDLFKIKPISVLQGKAAKAKMKKGVRLVDAREVIMELTFRDPSSEQEIVYHLVSPIQGKLLEINSQIRSNPRLLFERPFSDGYIAVLSSVVPDIIGRCGPSILSLESEASISQLCFQWIRGTCPKGNTCKYFHPAAASAISPEPEM